MMKLVAGVIRKRLATLLFGLLEGPFGEVVIGVMRLVVIGMSSLEVAVKSCRASEGFITVRARVSKFAGTRESHEFETKKIY